MTPERQVERAARAQAILDDDIVMDALKAMEADYIKAWAVTEARDTQARELAWMGMKAVEAFVRKLQSVITTGKLASHELEKRMK